MDRRERAIRKADHEAKQKKAGARERAKRKKLALAAQQASEGQVTPLQAEPSAPSQTEPQERTDDAS